ncbi:hypothetical protein SLA2020_473140 [Shorea laevis]
MGATIEGVFQGRFVKVNVAVVESWRGRVNGEKGGTGIECGASTVSMNRWIAPLAPTIKLRFVILGQIDDCQTEDEISWGPHTEFCF